VKITVTKDNGEEDIFDGVSDYYLAVRCPVPLTKDKKIFQEIQTRSYSSGSNLRDIIKELRQSTIELQDYFDKIRNE